MGVLTRKTFIEGASAFALTFGRRMFAAPSGWIPPKKPNLVFGVLADTHLRISRDGGYDGRKWPDKYLVAALKYFRSQNRLCRRTQGDSRVGFRRICSCEQEGLYHQLPLT